MSEITDAVKGLTTLKLRQSRTIARIVDRRAAALAAQTDGAPAEDVAELGYQFSLELLAAALDMTLAQVEELGGTLTELPGLVPRIMELAGFATMGETKAAVVEATAAPSIGNFNGSTARSPAPTDTLPQLSGK